MAAKKRTDLIQVMRARDLAALRVALKANPAEARSPRAIVEAGRLGWKAAAELLVKNGADPNSSWRGYRALHNLIQEVPDGAKSEQPSEDRLACLDWLLSHGADPEQLGAFPPARALAIAVFSGESVYVEKLMKAGAVVDDFTAAAMGDKQRVAKRLKKDPGFVSARDPGGLTPLHYCAASRMGAQDPKGGRALLEIARMLIDGGADVNALAKGWSRDLDVAYFALGSHQREMFALLLDRGAEPKSALASAVWGDLQAAGLPLKHGAKINETFDEGKPLLNQMIRWGQFKAAMWLLEHGASPNIADDRGWTAVHQAVSRGNENMLTAIVKAGGDAKLKDAEGVTSVHLAHQMGRKKLQAILLTG